MAGQTHQRAIFIASFLTLIAAGMGFAIRGDVLADWELNFGFTKTELGTITGGGLTGFGVTIIICSLFADRIGYKAIMLGAFVLHVLSAVITLAATPVYESMGKDATYQCLYWGMFMFSLANGLCEAAINPLVATLYPRQKTHYLNILHAGWPGGLILGGLLAYLFVGPGAQVTHLRWEIPMAFFLIPTVIYGAISLKEHFPISEARAAGVQFGDMIKQFAAPMLLFLLFLHACVGYVELGTDSWITDIMKPVIKSSVLLLVYTSGIMFVLRFFAGPIVERINPLGLLFVSALFGVTGLYMLGSPTNTTTFGILAAATVYGFGKTFLWPTMLGVVGERFPKGGALTMGTMGGIGMLSAGLLGGPGIGYKQDYFAKEQLETTAPSVYEAYRSTEEKGFLMFPKIAGLDGKKVGALQDKVKELTTESKDKTLNVRETLPQDEQQVLNAVEYGGRMALRYTAIVPATMAVGYLLLIFYFMSKGGYRAVELDSAGHEHESARKPSAADAIYKDSKPDQA
jgi:MFS family permease